MQGDVPFQFFKALLTQIKVDALIMYQYDKMSFFNPNRGEQKMITNGVRIRGLMLASVAGFALTACGGSSTPVEEPPVIDPPEETSAVTTGTTSGTQSSNGLQFADGTGITLEDLSGGLNDEKTLTLRAARLNTADLDEADDTLSAELVDMEISSIQNEGDEWIITADIDGVTMLINYTEGNPDPCGISATDGLVYCTGFFDQIGDNVAVLYLAGEGGDDDGEYESHVVTVIGLETDPDYLAFKGMAYYEGGFYLGGFGIVDGEIVGGSTTSGLIGIEADFAAATIEGGMGDPGFGVEFEGTIEGNGWTATDTDSSFLGGDFEKTDGEIQLDGVFYGSTGQETAGTIVMNVELTEDTIDPDPIVIDAAGVGGFIAYEQEP